MCIWHVVLDKNNKNTPYYTDPHRDPRVVSAVVIDVEDAAAEQQRRHTQAHSFCHSCHSGGLMGSLLCENAECPALYTRVGAAARLQAIAQIQKRIDGC